MSNYNALEMWVCDESYFGSEINDIFVKRATKRAD